MLQQNNVYVNKVYGTSLGGLVAACLVCNVKIEPIWNYHWKWREQHNTLSECYGTIKDHIISIFNIFFNHNTDIYKLANHRLFMNIIELPFFRHKIKSIYNSNQDLLDTILQTQYIPFWTSNSIAYKMCIDGGIYLNSIGDNDTLFFNCNNDRVFKLISNIIHFIMLGVVVKYNLKIKYLYYLYILYKFIRIIIYDKKMYYKCITSSMTSIFKPSNYNQAINMSINGSNDILHYLLKKTY
jgi:hypothetical protein